MIKTLELREEEKEKSSSTSKIDDKGEGDE